jgi:hypothetical protein
MGTATARLVLVGLSLLVVIMVVVRHAPGSPVLPPSPPPSDPKVGGWVCRPNGDHKLCKWEY